MKLEITRNPFALLRSWVVGGVAGKRERHEKKQGGGFTEHIAFPSIVLSAA